jgi:hypothetical protein
MEDIIINYLLFKKPYDHNEQNDKDVIEYKYVRCDLLNTDFHFVYQMYKPISQIDISTNE